jgi:hypothetical protein
MRYSIARSVMRKRQSSTRMPFTRAVACIRAAVLTTSPAAMPRRVRDGRQFHERLTGATATRTCSPASSLRAQSRMASAARTARSGSSSWVPAPEQGHDRIPDELLDGSSSPLELSPKGARGTGEDRLDILGVQRLGAPC